MGCNVYLPNPVIPRPMAMSCLHRCVSTNSVPRPPSRGQTFFPHPRQSTSTFFLVFRSFCVQSRDKSEFSTMHHIYIKYYFHSNIHVGRLILWKYYLFCQKLFSHDSHLTTSEHCPSFSQSVSQWPKPIKNIKSFMNEHQESSITLRSTLDLISTIDLDQ